MAPKCSSAGSSTARTWRSSQSRNGFEDVTEGRMSAPAEPRITNALSVDVEDYFQVQALSGTFPMQHWDGCESRVERNTDALLETFADAGVHATFFTLGWIA